MKKKLILFYKGMSSVIISVVYRNTSLCQNDETFSCDQYNTITQRISWGDRKNRCKSINTCDFVGWSITGKCVGNFLSMNDHDESDEIKSASLESNKDIENIKKSESKTIETSKESVIKSPKDIIEPLYYEMIGMETSAKKRLYVIINQQLTSSAVDQIRDSQTLVNDLARSLIIEMLKHEKSPNHLGEFLQSTFSHQSAQQPTREFVLSSLAIDSTVTNIKLLMRDQEIYWLRGEAYPYTYSATIDFFDWWLTHPLTSSLVLIPQIKWILEQPDLTINPVKEVATSALKSQYIQV
jgi:hypothetical protein